MKKALCIGLKPSGSDLVLNKGWYAITYLFLLVNTMDDNNAVYPDSMDWCYNTKRKYLKIFEEQGIIKKIGKLYFANPLFYFYEDGVYPQVIDLFAKTNKEKFGITKL